MTIDLSDFFKQQEDEIKEQLASLVNRGILVIKKTPLEVSMLTKSPDGTMSLNLRQRLGVAVETEAYIEKMEECLRDAMKVVNAAKAFCSAPYGARDHLLSELMKRLEELKC